MPCQRCYKFSPGTLPGDKQDHLDTSVLPAFTCKPFWGAAQARLVLATLFLLVAHVTHAAASSFPSSAESLGSTPTPIDQSRKGRQFKAYATRSLLNAPRYPAQQPGLIPESMPSSEVDAQGPAKDIYTLEPLLTQIRRIPISGSEIQRQDGLQSSTITGAFCLPFPALLARMRA